MHAAQICRTLNNLIAYLGRSTEFPDGAVLLTGSRVVPPDDLTLMAGDVVTMTIDGNESPSN